MKLLNKPILVALSVAFVVVTAAVTGCTGSGQEGQRTQSRPKDAKAVQYTCSMHPEVSQDKPGDCPKCGMKLVEKP